MKHKLKKAFTLFEILIVLAIIAVLTVMFMTISKKGLESAYNTYYYASYSAIYDAIQYSYARNADPNLSDKIDYYWVGKAHGFSKDASNNTIAKKKTTGTITYPATSNGIQFTINNSGTYYTITAVIPSANGNVSAQYYFYPNINNGILVPYKAGEIKLYQRKDLLPFFVDDGIVGRDMTYIDKDKDSKELTIDEYDNWDNNKRLYDSFDSIYCSLENVSPTIKTLIEKNSCSGSKKGIIRVANPKKVL